VLDWKSGFHFLVAFWYWAAAIAATNLKKKKLHIPARFPLQLRWYV